MTQLPFTELLCAICGHPGTVTAKALNGLPKGVVACEDCRQAVHQRQVGVTRSADGTLSVTDGRGLRGGQ